MNITQTAFKYYQVTYVALALLLLAGLGSYFNLSRNENPSYIVRIGQVVTYMPGASPKRVEELVTNKIEEKIQEMPELEFMTSESKPGVSIITVKMQDRYTDMPPIWEKLRRRVGNVEKELPETAQAPIVNDEYGDVYGIVVGIVWDGFNYARVEKIAEAMRKKLLYIDDIAKVDILGEQEERVFIEYHTSKLNEVGISPTQLTQSLKQRNIINPGGVITSPTKRIPVEPSGNYDSVEDIAQTLIQIPNTDKIIKLEDIAHVYRSYIDPPLSKMHTSGKPSIGIAITMREGGNIVKLGKEVQEMLHKEEQQLPYGVEFQTLVFHPELVTTKINNFVGSLSQAVLIVCAVMLFFLGFRTGMVVASLIPMAIFISFLAMKLLNIGLDQVSLASLMIALGMLVDSGIVMAENISIQMELGKPPIQAAIKSASELKMSLLISSLTTSAAFLPIYLAESSTGEYTASIFKVVTITLLISWTLSITVIPMLCVRFLKVRPTNQEDIDSKWVNTTYRNLLIGMLRHRWKTLFVLIAVFIISVGALKLVPKLFFPPSDAAIVTVDLDLPVGASLNRTENTVQAMDRFIEKELLVNETRKEGVVSWLSYIGEGGPRYRLQHRPEAPNPHYAFTLINTTSVDLVPMIIEKMDNFFFEHFPDVRAKVRPAQEGAPVNHPVEVRVYGEDPETLLAIADEVKEKIESIPGTKTVVDDWGTKFRKIAVTVDETRAQRALVTHADVARSLQAALSGVKISEYRENDQIIPIVMRSVVAKDFHLLNDETFNVYSSVTGKSVPLAQVGKTDMVWENAQIRHRDRFRAVTVSAMLEPGTYARGVNKQLTPWLTEVSKTWPKNYRWEFGGEAYQSEKANSSIRVKLPIAGVLIVILLMMQFNCIRNTAIILATIPMGIIGVSFGLLATNTYFGFMTLLGMISLTGIVINDAIVLLERIVIEREEEKRSLPDAVVFAAQRRMRPILLTTVTTVVGMMPLWFGGGPMWEPMVVAIIFGLLAATVLTLGAIPVLYSFFFNVRFDDYVWNPSYESVGGGVEEMLQEKIDRVAKRTTSISK